ncbi:MAG: DNA topoisomerase (ATP-hydrolyzing) subunit B [Patescibacteria group bacterium]|jgi:DNA gyrase subunit B
MAIKKDTKKNAPKNPSESYGASSITVLKGLDPVRKRPGMYIGGTGIEGLHHLIWEVVDNSIDEAMAGYCKNIKVTLFEGNKVTVYDDGRGIPVEIHKATKKSTLETVLTVLHAGGKFGGGGYKVSGGLHGVGVSVVNALSQYLKAEVTRDGYLWEQEYKRGKAQGKIKKVKKASGTGTAITFDPDPEIFPKIEFDWKTIVTHLRQQAYLTKGVKISITDERKGHELAPNIPRALTFYFEGGILSYVKFLNRTEKVVHPNPFYIEKAKGDCLVEVALQYTEEIKGIEMTFANNIYTPEGGTHLMGFRTALTRVINDYARKNGYLKEKEDNLTGDDVREGQTAVVSLKLPEPQFEGQTKAKLGNSEIRPIVSSIVYEYFSQFLEEHPQDARAIMAKTLLACKARLAAKAAKETVIRKGIMEGLTLPGKLADCSSRKPEESELYIVEGDSAGGSAKQGRDRNFQAILPLRGKILNVERARIDKMLGSKEIKALIIAMGMGVGEEKEIEKMRYHRIIIMTDADVDGAHIRTLLLTFFYRYYAEIIEKGYLYIAQPPLYRVEKNKKVDYAYTDQDKERILKEIEKTSVAKKTKKSKIEKAGFTVKELETGEENGEEKVAGVNIQRYKGLGEMNPEQLWETTMDPKNRVMLQVKVEDAAKADETFDILMGNEVEPRKRFIQTHAAKVKNLDI